MFIVWILGIVLGLVFLLIVRYTLHFKEWIDSSVGYGYTKGKFSRAAYLFVFGIFCIPGFGIVTVGLALISLLCSLIMGDTALKVKIKNKTIQKIADYLAEEV